MGVTILKLGKPSPLLPEERVVHEQRRSRAVSVTTLPSYRIGFNLPPLWRIRLLVTNRRCLALSDLFHCMTQEIAMWYPGHNPDDDPETITKVSCQTGLFGRCLELRTHNPKRRQRWLWSPDLTLRFFVKEPELIEAAILTQMKESGGANDGFQRARPSRRL
ncbi:MAG TPA: hypothetical protein VMW24_06770 [Sedimentisphaerales bacterium]|nr:hypothetical protein [Sedimentisphaerales bacterium]